MAITDTSDLPPKTRIVATTTLPGVPEGTTGKLGRSVGLTLTRYRVAFDNGVDLTSVTHTDVVCEDEWDEFLAQRDAEEAAAGEPAPSDAAPAPEGGTGESSAAAPADDRLAALLAKSKAAKAKKMGTAEDQADAPAPAEEPAAAEPEAPAASPADDRLAALLAKSKAAKEKKLAEG